MPKRVTVRSFVPRYEALIWRVKFDDVTDCEAVGLLKREVADMNREVLTALSPSGLSRVKRQAHARYDRKRAKGRKSQ